MTINKVIDALSFLSALPLCEKIEAINAIRAEIHKYSPFAAEPVDFVKWVPSNSVQANNYNPNKVAPPEMELLKISIDADGYTQPIVANKENENFIVVDGFHRNRVGKECEEIVKRVHNYLPIVQIRESQVDAGARIASTIRHNRARGKHTVNGMSEIVLDLRRRNWSPEKIGRELGMDPDEVLRLTQITGLAEMFANKEFSEAWEAGTLENGEIVDESVFENE